MPPRAPVEVQRAVRRQVHGGRVVKARPRVGGQEGRVRVGEGHPDHERAVAVLAQHGKRLVADPAGGHPFVFQRRAPDLPVRGQRRHGLFRPRPAFTAASVPVEEVLVVQGLGPVLPAAVMVRAQGQLDLLEAHVGAVPVLGVVSDRVVALGHACGREGFVGGQVRLADEPGVIPGAREDFAQPVLGQRGVEVAAVVAHAVAVGQLARQDRGARRLAHGMRGYAGVEPGAAGGDAVDVGGADPPPGAADGVAALLVRGDQKDVGRSRHSAPGPPARTSPARFRSVINPSPIRDVFGHFDNRFPPDRRRLFKGNRRSVCKVAGARFWRGWQWARVCGCCGRVGRAGHIRVANVFHE